jgi:uncharacterized coiled-coil DUF342 family protein
MPTFEERMTAAGIDPSVYAAWKTALLAEIDALRVQKQNAIAARQEWTATRDALTIRINNLRQILDGVNEP